MRNIERLQNNIKYHYMIYNIWHKYIYQYNYRKDYKNTYIFFYVIFMAAIKVRYLNNIMSCRVKINNRQFIECTIYIE